MNTATLRVQTETAMAASMAQNARVISDQTNTEEEKRLLERCKAGDMAAWDKLVRKYEKPVYRFAYSLCKNPDDAADIAGHVFVRVYQNLRSFRHESTFTSWLFRIVRNAHMDLCIRPARCSNISLDTDNRQDGTPCEARDVEDPAESPEALSMRSEVQRILAHAIRHLPAYQRDVLSMFHIDGKSYEEIAEATGLAIGTVKSRLNRARTLLRERLTPYKDILVSA